MRHRHPNAFTLLEIMIALTIMAICSVAYFTLVAGSLRTDSYLRQAYTSLSEIDLASRRITHNLRLASALTTPTTTTATSTVTLVTQPDPNNGGATYTVTYSWSGSQLTENDSRYGSNVIANNVTNFSAKLNSITSPKTITITLTQGAPGLASRSFTIYCRNL